MNNTRNTSVILLTYKCKVLLSVNDFNSENPAQNVWGMIESKKRAYESFLEPILHKIKDEMNIKLKNVSFLFKTEHEDEILYFSHGKLTDDDVNSITRKEKQEIGFYTLLEAVKLQLAPATSSLVSEHRHELEQLLVHVGDSQ